MSYKKTIIDAMGWLAEQPDTIFIGQTVGVPGSYIFSSLEKVPKEKRVELPVAEELQMGMALGLAMEGYVPICIYPRIDFMLLALNQLVNHIDKIGVMSEGRMKTKIILRTSIGPKAPLHGGVQHTQNHVGAIRELVAHCNVVDLARAFDPWKPEYERLMSFYYKGAYTSLHPATIIIESGQRYND